MSAAVEVRHRKPGTAQDKRRDGRFAGRVRLAIVADRSADSLCGFVENAVMLASLIVTDDWSGYVSLRKRGYDHHPIAESGDPEIAEQFMPIIHLVFQFEDLAQRHPPRRERQASTSLPQRIHVPLQPALLPLQLLPLAARHCGRRRGADLCPALFRRMGTPYIW